MPSTKTVLFVTYGGGHARMVAPVVRELQSDSDLRVETLAATAGGSIFKSECLPFRGYKDFLLPHDNEAVTWGKKLAAEQHNADSGMGEAESIAYLGLCYQDLVTRHGEKEAARLWNRKGRHAFLPLSIMDRVMDIIRPDVVVTTNSPRSEQAAIAVAKRRGIPTVAMVDLFGVRHFHTLEADYITVLSESVIDTLRANGVRRPREAFVVTGNPAFDPALDFRGPINYSWRRTNFPTLPDAAKTVLWTDIPGYWNLQTNELYLRGEAEVLSDLDKVHQAAQGANAWLLVRPHPSQRRALYDRWMENRTAQMVLYAGDLPLYPLLNAVDLVTTYISTTGLQALLMGRRLVQIDKCCPGGSGEMPLAAWELAWGAQNVDALPGVIRTAFRDEAGWQEMKSRVETRLRQEKAAPKVAEHIRRLLNSPPYAFRDKAI